MAFLKDGTEFHAPVVASNMDVKRTFLRHVDRAALPEEFTRAVERFKIRGSSAKLNIALDGLPDPPSTRHDPKLMRGGLNVSPSMEYLERGYDDWKNGTWSQKPYLDIFLPST